MLKNDNDIESLLGQMYE